jgi:uncharacterized cupin superfamily protein
MKHAAKPNHGPVPEAPLHTADGGGLEVNGSGWYVVNVADAQWYGDGRSACCTFEGEPRFQQYGTNIHVLTPGTPNASYHREHYEDESFFVLSGECIAVIEGHERALRAGDFVFCPAGTAHVFVGAGEAPCAIFMFGGRVDPPGVDGCTYVADPAAARHGAAVLADTSDPKVAYADATPFEPVADPWWTPA